MDRVKRRRLRRGVAVIAAVAVSGFLLFKTCGKPKPEGPLKSRPTATKPVQRTPENGRELRERLKRRVLLRSKLSKIFKIKIKRDGDPAFDFGSIDFDLTDACARLSNTKKEVRQFLDNGGDLDSYDMSTDANQLVDPYLLHAMRTALRQFGRDSYEGEDPNGNDNLFPLTAKGMLDAINSSRAVLDQHSKWEQLFWLDSRSERDFQAYLVAHELFRLFYHNSHDSNVKVPEIWIGANATKPGVCYNGLMTCLFEDFSYMAQVTPVYCASEEGRQDAGRCKDGKPRNEPPEACYGYADFVAYVRDCAMQYFPEHIKADFGSDVMAVYYRLRNECL